MKKSIVEKLFAAFVLFIFLQSCSVWKNFTTYFNTYYNARSQFDRIEEEILKQKKDPFEFRVELKSGQQPQQQQYYQGTPPIQQQQYNPGVQPYQQQQYGSQPAQQQYSSTTPTLSQTQIQQDLTKVIEKCSKILQFDKESSYFDDALFITGKSFYYQQEYARAQRKFLELSALTESEYYTENKLWLAKTYLQLRSFDEGISLIDEVKTEALNQENEELFVNASITKIGFYLFRQEFRLAIDECNKFLETSKSDEYNALVNFQLGKIYLKQNDQENGLKAFASVLNFSPTFEVEFESRLEYAKLLKEMKKYDESESVLLNLRDGGKFNNNMERILVEIGQIYSAKEEFEEAIEVFKDVDTTYRYTQSAGLAQFKLAEIYQKKIRDYDSTLKYFNKVIASSYIGNERTIATEQVRNFDKYFQLKNKKDELNLQIVYLQQPDKYLRDSTDYDIAYNEYLQEMRKKADMMNQMNYGIQQQNQTNPDNHQQTQQQQQTAIKNPNEKLSLAKLIEIGKAKKPVKPLVSLDSMKVILAQNYYELASHFFSELEVPDSAFFYFNSILNDYPNRTNKAQTLYALGTYFETLEQREKADSLYKIIYDEFPKSDLYKEAAKKLGLLKEEDKKSVAQTSDPAEELYLNAEKNYYDKKFREAIKEFRNIYLSHPKSNYAPKAIFFIGLIHEELKENDSAAFYYGILSSKENAATPLGSKVFSKYTEYKNEKERLEKIELEKQEAEKQKALLEKQKAVTDSVKVNPAMLTNEKDEVDIRPIKRDSTNVQNKKVISDSTAMKKSVPDSTQKK